MRSAMPTQAPAAARLSVRAQATKAKPKSAAPKAEGRTLWFPNTVAPAWLDGSMPGDAGFDPLSLGKPAEYLLMDLDALDQNVAINKAGKIIGKLKPVDNKPKGDALQPYANVFDLDRFRECELIHGRWAMLATLGALFAELSTGVNWLDAGKVELEQGSSYFGLGLPFDLTQLVIIQVLLVGAIEVFRNGELDPEKRIYPGGFFDPLKLASDGGDQAFRLRTAEIKHSRLAMVAFFGFGVQAGVTHSGSLLDALEKAGGLK